MATNQNLVLETRVNNLKDKILNLKKAFDGWHLTCIIPEEDEKALTEYIIYPYDGKESFTRKQNINVRSRTLKEAKSIHFQIKKLNEVYNFLLKTFYDFIIKIGYEIKPEKTFSEFIEHEAREYDVKNS